jgi:cyclic pyranopterin phosphate synthase
VDLTHVDSAGAARMVDVSAKEPTARTAVASGVLRTTAEVIDLLRRDGLPKGDALATARIAGIMAAKRTPDLVPLCHPIALSGVVVELEAEGSGGAGAGDGPARPTARAWRWRRSRRSPVAG